MDAVTIIEINDLLSKRLPNTQLLWQPSTGNMKYTWNVLFKGNVDDLVDTIVKHRGDQELIVLMIHDKCVYYN